MKKGREGKKGAPCILPSPRPDPALLAGQGRGSYSHQLQGCCAFLMQTVAGVPSPALPTKPEIPPPWVPAHTLGPEISETPVIPKANTNRPNYINGENLVQMLSRQERRLAGRSQDSSPGTHLL